MQVTCPLMGEKAQWHTPVSLPGDAPVRPVSNHRGDPRLTPLRDPANFLNFLQSVLTQITLIHADKPLLCGSEDNGGFRTPTMGVAMGDTLLFNQPVVFIERG